MARHGKQFFHFTCRLWWRFILKEGIVHGEVPVGGGRILDHPNLTTDPDPANQDWAGTVGDSHIIGGKRMVMTPNKRAIRIGVELSPRDPGLIRWVALARATGLDERAISHLNEAGGGRMTDWWVFRGVIRPKQFVSVEFLDDGQVPEVERRMIDYTRPARTSAYAMKMLGLR